MDPIPKMVIPTTLAKRKGEIEVASADEIDALISQLIIAKTGIRGAQSAIGAQVALDAARAVEAERQAEDDVEAEIYCGAISRWGEECTLEEHPGTPHVDTKDREWADDGELSAATLYEPDSADEPGPMDDEAELRRAEKLREDWKPVLTGLGERVTALSAEPEPARTAPGDEDRYHGMIPVHDGMLRFCALPPGHGFGCRDADGKMIFPEHQPLASVTPLRSDSDVIPATQVPCPEAHPSRGTLCTGKIPHPMPHVDPDGETWVTEHATAIIGGAS